MESSPYQSLQSPRDSETRPLNWNERIVRLFGYVGAVWFGLLGLWLAWGILSGRAAGGYQIFATLTAWGIAVAMPCWAVFRITSPATRLARRLES